MFARIDRKRKLHATVVLKALGYSTQEILDMFYNKETITLDKNGNIKEAWTLIYSLNKSATDIIDEKTGKVVVKKGKKFTKLSVEKLNNAGITSLPVSNEELVGK